MKQTFKETYKNFGQVFLNVHEFGTRHVRKL